jgi:hypothetical protein
MLVRGDQGGGNTQDHDLTKVEVRDLGGQLGLGTGWESACERTTYARCPRKR